MLMIAPLICARMIGIAYFAAKMQLFRLMATTRSIASSVMAESSASPPARLTPTLLCRMSMRPQRAFASATIALISLSRVTSASKAAAAPPFSAIDAQHAGAFAGESDGGGAAVAHAFASALAGADHDGGTILQAHVHLLCFL